MARKCQSFLASYHNLDYDQRRNGETFLLDALSSFDFRIVFDVGANVGDWTRAVSGTFPRAAVHSFEICPPTYQTLLAATRDLPNVHPVSVGLSDRAGVVEIQYYEENPALTTAFAFHAGPAVKIEARVTTGAAYCIANGIEHIDFLKIDVEGMENLVLEGFGEMIPRGDVDLIQFEYGQVNILSKFLLRDYYAWFADRGFAVGKIYPNYVDFREYSFADENFIGPNYLACRKERDDYIRLLRR